MVSTLKGFLHGLSVLSLLAFPDRDATFDGSQSFRLYSDASRDGFGSTLEKDQTNRSIRPVTFPSRVTLPNERNWTILELEAGAVV